MPPMKSRSQIMFGYLFGAPAVHSPCRENVCMNVSPGDAWAPIPGAFLSVLDLSPYIFSGSAGRLGGNEARLYLAPKWTE